MPQPLYGNLRLSEVFSTSKDVFFANSLALMAIVVVAFVLNVFATIACLLPVFFVGPLLTWGTAYAVLEAIDGRCQVGSLFEGFNRIGTAYLPTLGLLILLTILAIPGTIVGGVVSLIIDPSALDDPATFFGAQPSSNPVAAMLAQIASAGMSTLWAIFVSSLTFPAIYFIVDRGYGPVKALSSCFTLLVGPAWLASTVLVMSTYVLTALSVLPCGLLLPVASAFNAVIFGVAYRQLSEGIPV